MVREDEGLDSENLKRYTIYEDGNIVEAMQKIDANARGILFVCNNQGRLSGTVTDGDIRRWLIRTGEMEGCIRQIMNPNPRIIYVNDRENAAEILHRYSINALPVVDPEGYILDIVFDDTVLQEIREKRRGGLKEVPVIIMAGGKGTRLYPYTKILPKPLIPIGDIPIMERIIDCFRDYGVERFFVTLNYRKSMIKSYFAEMEKGYVIQYVEEDKPLGTAGSLRLIKEEFHCPIIVTNCDILIRADYEDIYRYHKEAGNRLTIVAALKNILVPYGVIHSKEKGIIMNIEEKPKISYFVNTGMYVLDPELLALIPEDSFYHMTDLAADLLKAGEQIGMYPVSEDSFLDMGEFEEMRRMEDKLFPFDKKLI